MDLYHFLSYTSREEETRQLRPLLDQYCLDLMRWGASHGIDIFYDRLSLQPKHYEDDDLRNILSSRIRRSHLMTAFVSPEYVTSQWCQFEWEESRNPDKPALHCIYWKPFSRDMLDVLTLLISEKWEPEAITDVTYIHLDPSPSRFEEGVSECVKDTIRLIEEWYM